MRSEGEVKQTENIQLKNEKTKGNENFK